MPTGNQGEGRDGLGDVMVCDGGASHLLLQPPSFECKTCCVEEGSGVLTLDPGDPGAPRGPIGPCQSNGGYVRYCISMLEAEMIVCVCVCLFVLPLGQELAWKIQTYRGSHQTSEGRSSGKKQKTEL